MTDKCNACLSSERLLQPIKGLGINSDILKFFRIDKPILICWECRARFRSVEKFRRQVSKVQRMLTDEVQIKKTYSNLSETLNENIDYEFKYEIKTEPVSDDDDCMEEVNFGVPDVAFGDDEEEMRGEEECLGKRKREEQEECAGAAEAVKDKVKKEVTYEVMIEPMASEDEDSEETESSEDEMTDQGGQSSVKRYTIRIMKEAELRRVRKKNMSDSKFKLCPYKCDSCIFGRWKLESFEKHMAKYHFEGDAYTCEICKRKFLSEEDCNSHTENHYCSYKCNLCEFESHRLGLFNSHYRSKHAQQYICVTCNKKFHSVRKLQDHRLKKHGPFLECIICKEIFTTFESLREHMMTHVEIPTFKCDFCEKSYKSRSTLRTHVQSMHKPPPPDTNAYCTECDYQFDNLDKYQKHLASNPKHTNSGSYKCDQCDKTFLKKANFQRHVNWMHLKRHAHHCHMCDKVFDRPERLSKHIQHNHEGVVKERKFVCEYCDRKFYEMNTLRSHIMIHTGEKPFECEMCDERFRQRAALRVHIRGVHKKIKKIKKIKIKTEDNST